MADSESSSFSAEETLFKDSRRVESVELITGYLSPDINSKQRSKALRRVNEFCEDVDNRELFYHSIAQMRVDMVTRDDNLSSKRLEGIDNLFEKLNKRYVFLEPELSDAENEALSMYELTVYAIMARYERSKITFPIESVNLANEALKSGFPEFFGREIPELKLEDVVMITDESNRSEQTSWRQVNKVKRDYYFGDNEPGKIELSENPADAMTFLVYGKPVLIREHEEFLEAGLGSSPEIYFARLLVHEAIHRAQEVRTTSDPAIFDIAYRPFYKNASKEGFAQRALDFKRDVIQGNASSVVSGATVFVSSRDEEALYKPALIEGNDITEGTVEFLISDALDHLMQYVSDKYPQGHPLFKILKEFMKSGSGSTHGENNLTEEVEDYYRSLGVEGRNQIFKAFIQGEGPFLQAKKNEQSIAT